MFGLTKILVYFYLYSSVSGMYDYLKKSDRTSSKYVSSKTVPSNYEHFVKQPRYPKFDEVKIRLDKMYAESDANSNEVAVKMRHKGKYRQRTTTTTTTTTTETPLFEDIYGEYENDDYDYEALEDDDFEYEDDESDTDEPLFDSIYGEVQAEEPTDRTTTTEAPKSFSSLTEYKWHHFGTIERVQKSRTQHVNLQKSSSEEFKIEAVVEHYVRVKQQSKCLRPLPRVIPVQREHPDPTKIYTPQCTILHRCAEDSGCCNMNTKCQYKSRVLVPLYLYEKTAGTSQNRIVKLEFYNHTECECKEKTEYASSETTSNYGIPFRSSENNTPTPENIKRCKCPKPFQSLDNSPKCSCDCDEDDSDCLQLKKGKEHFSMNNRECIGNGECAYPKCEYGTYMVSGKCPSKLDKIEEYKRINLIRS
ncbi:hypothetical protein JTB14_017734 [Gonioctena quinquepunctata]|nr:hypothetical protein JTB14_017734 [Gonioctena quinquepunctata]